MNVICDYSDLITVDMMHNVILINIFIILCGIAIFIYLIISSIIANKGNDAWLEAFPVISTIVAVITIVSAVSSVLYCTDYIAYTSHITVVELSEDADTTVLENFYNQYKDDIVGELPGKQYIIKVPYTSE